MVCGAYTAGVLGSNDFTNELKKLHKKCCYLSIVTLFRVWSDIDLSGSTIIISPFASQPEKGKVYIMQNSQNDNVLAQLGHLFQDFVIL